MEKRGKYVMTLLPGLRGMAYRALVEAENQLGRPVRRNDILAQMARTSLFIPPNPILIMIVMDMYRNDELLADYEEAQFSIRPEMQDTPTNPTGFELYSDRVTRLFPTYVLDTNLKLWPGPDTPTVNFSYLRSLLMSKDLTRSEELNWTRNGLRFLDATEDLVGQRIAFLSFPRTGNTMTRKYIESVTGIYTGADLELLFAHPLQLMGMPGEEHTCNDRTVWVTKTHWPSCADVPQKDWTFDKGFVVTRNPIDAIYSMFLMLQFGCMSAACEEKINEKCPDNWDDFLRIWVPKFKAFHDFVINRLASENVPVYFLRYEDGTNHSNQTLTELFQFILDEPNIQGTILKQRIDEVTSHSFEMQQVYKLKSTKTLNRNIDVYSKEQLLYIQTELKDFLYYFGYVDNDEDPMNNTPFFTYDHSPECLSKYQGYKKHNANILNQLGSQNPENAGTKVPRAYVKKNSEGEIAGIRFCKIDLTLTPVTK